MPTIQEACNHPITALTVICFCCQRCKQHCDCPNCPSCGMTLLAEELCPNCHLCGESCCSCRRCAGPCDSVKGAGYFCENCNVCVDTCCKCYTCTTCKESFRARVNDFCGMCLNCKEHCREMTCREGHKASRKGFCNHCERCVSHCVCSACPQCKVKTLGVNANSVHYAEYYHVKTTRTLISEDPCGLCRRCCRCKVIGVDFRSGKFQLFHSVFGKGQFKRNPLRRHLSVEMEVDRYSRDMYSTKVNKALDKWQDPVVQDGSVRDGFEINTNPCNGDLFLDHIYELCEGLRDIQAGCTTACGIHVHVNVKGTPLVKEDGTPVMKNNDMVYDHRSAYTHYDLRRLIMLYYFIEPAVYGLCSPARLSSKYAKPCGKFYLTKNTSSKDFRKDIAVKMYRGGRPLPQGFDPNKPKKVLKKQRTVIRFAENGDPVYGFVTPKRNTEFKQIGREITSVKAQKYHAIRYNSLNLHSFFMRGTVEFRHKEGSVDFNEISNWALICGYIVEAASKMTEQQIKDLPKDPRKALLAILPTDLQQFCERKWEAQDKEQPRFKQMVEETWGGQINYEV